MSDERVGMRWVVGGVAGAAAVPRRCRARSVAQTYDRRPTRAPATDPWDSYKLRLAALARQQGVREATIQANVPGLTSTSG